MSTRRWAKEPRARRDSTSENARPRPRARIRRTRVGSCRHSTGLRRLRLVVISRSTSRQPPRCVNCRRQLLLVVFADGSHVVRDYLKRSVGFHDHRLGADLAVRGGYGIPTGLQTSDAAGSHLHPPRHCRPPAPDWPSRHLLRKPRGALPLISCYTCVVRACFRTKSKFPYRI